jgi:hypothetical protein
MTRKTVRITRKNGVILFFEIGPGNLPLRRKKVSIESLKPLLIDAGMHPPDIEGLLKEFSASGSVVVSFVPNGRLHYRI